MASATKTSITVTAGADRIREARRRRDAAWRCEPIRHGAGLARRDPWLELSITGPSSYSLRQHELLAEIARCRDFGFTDDELRQLFVDPRTVSL